MDKNEPRINGNERSFDQQDLVLQLSIVEEKLADVKARWPYHSVQPSLVAEREDLEEERERLLNLLSAE